MKRILSITSVLSVILLIVSCGKKNDFTYYFIDPKDQEMVEKYLNVLNEDGFPEDYTVNFPNHLRQTGLFPRAVDKNKAMLGRVLFYDKKLSKDGKVSCASCHRQDIAFGDDAKVSKGVYDRSGERNSLPLGSVSNFSAYYGTDINGSLAIPFFWDNRAGTIAEQATAAIENEKEMAMHMTDVELAVSQQPYYAPLFKKAFDRDPSVSKEKVLEAIGNFINAMGSFESPFDEAASRYQGSLGGSIFSSNSTLDYQPLPTPLPGFTQQQMNGYNLYRVNCASCHSPNMGRPMVLQANNGLDAVTTDDKGIGKHTGRASDMGTFKVPTLRNIAITQPYMHDGRFATLEDVIDHYSTGIQNHPNLDPQLKKNGQPLRMNFSAQQKSDLIAFFNTLTDEKLKVATRFSDPFIQ
jgi:cytochrome c peroxidase